MSRSYTKTGLPIWVNGYKCNIQYDDTRKEKNLTRPGRWFKAEHKDKIREALLHCVCKRTGLRPDVVFTYGLRVNLKNSELLLDTRSDNWTLSWLDDAGNSVADVFELGFLEDLLRMVARRCDRPEIPHAILRWIDEEGKRREGKTKLYGEGPSKPTTVWGHSRATDDTLIMLNSGVMSPYLRRLREVVQHVVAEKATAFPVFDHGRTFSFTVRQAKLHSTFVGSEVERLVRFYSKATTPYSSRSNHRYQTYRTYRVTMREQTMTPAAVLTVLRGRSSDEAWTLPNGIAGMLRGDIAADGVPDEAGAMTDLFCDAVAVA